MCDKILTNKQSGNQAINQSSNQAINQSGNQAINQSSNQAINQSSNQAIKQSNNQTIKQSNNLPLTLKAWPAIAGATIGLCFLTQQVAKLFGIELPDQQNIEIVKKLAGFNWRFAFLCLQVLIIMPALEELVFRGLLFKLPCRVWDSRRKTREKTNLPATLHLHLYSSPFALVSSVLFSAAHYLAQPWPDAAFLALFFFGIAQCWLYRKTDRIWCAMLNHALFNLTNLVLLFALPGE